MKKTTMGLAALALSAGFVVADGHLDQEAAIKARQEAMRAIGAGAKAGDFTAINEAALAAKAAFAVDTTGNAMLNEAAPAIWEDAEKFNGIMDQLIELSAASDKALFGTCKSCHADFRIKN